VKDLLIVLALVVVAGSFYADYKWRQWMAQRKRSSRREP
jgi:hypothetical protein